MFRDDYQTDEELTWLDARAIAIELPGVECRTERVDRIAAALLRQGDDE